MGSPATCPECGSSEVRETERKLTDGAPVRAVVCDVCHWTSDRRLGRPPADRGKNLTLRRLLSDVRQTEDADDTAP